MGKDMVSLTIEGEVRQYPAGTSFLAISQEYQEKYPDDIVLVVYNNRLRELNKTAQRDGMLSFVTTADKTGKKTYRRSVTLLMQKAVYNLWGSEHISVRVLYSIGQGYYCELREKADGQERVIAVDEERAIDYHHTTPEQQNFLSLYFFPGDLCFILIFFFFGSCSRQSHTPLLKKTGR